MKDDSRDWLPGGGSRMRYFTLDVQHNPQPAELLEWGHWLEAERRKPAGESRYWLASTRLPGGFRVVTIFIGLDQSFLAEGPPILFETTAFYPVGRRPHELSMTGLGGKRMRLYRRGQRFAQDIAQLQYATWAGAMAGHAGVLEAVRHYRIELQAAHASGDQHQRIRVANRVFERIERNAAP